MHGCGESYPLSDDEVAAIAPHIPVQDRVGHRRVELYFFDKALGVQPPPPGALSRPSSPEYPEWRRRARETHDFSERIAHPVWMRLKDFALVPIERAVCRVVGRPAVGYLKADDGGWVLVPTAPDEPTCELEWTIEEADDSPRWPYHRRVFLDFSTGEERGRRMLTNLGYDRYSDVNEQVRAFQREFERERTGKLSDVIGELEPWHDGGPPPPKERGDAKSFSAPQAQPQQQPPPGRNQPGTTAPKREVNLVVGVVQGGKKLTKSEMTIDVRIDGSTGPGETFFLSNDEGIEIRFQYKDLLIGETYAIEVVRRDRGGKIRGYARSKHKVKGQPRPNDIDKVGLVLNAPVVTFAEEPTHKYGFDPFETVHYLDKTGATSSEKPTPAMDALSIAEGKTEIGKVKVTVKGIDPDQVEGGRAQHLRSLEHRHPSDGAREPVGGGSGSGQRVAVCGGQGGADRQSVTHAGCVRSLQEWNHGNRDGRQNPR